jgi:predicted metalloendopeptidase
MPLDAPEPILEPMALCVDGKDYPLKRIGLPELTQFLAWVKKRRPDPLEQIASRMDLFSPALQQIMMKEALAQFYKPITMASSEYLEAFMTDEGLKELVWYSVQKTGHAISREQCDKAVDAIQEEGGEGLGRLFATVAPNMKGLS